MRTCGLASYIIFSMIHMIYSREYARPSPTDMPYSQRDILNKKEDMKSYIKSLKSLKVAPKLLRKETDTIGHLLVEDEKIPVPSSARGLGEVKKIYLDQNKLRRYLRILDMELERTPATIELDSSKIIDYVKMLNNVNKHEGKTAADLVSRSRIKLMKGGITDNILYDEKGIQQDADFDDEDYPVDKRDTEDMENVNDNSIYASAKKNNLFLNSNIAANKPEESLDEDLDSQKAANSEFYYSKSAGDTAINQYIESDNDDLDSDVGNQLLSTNIRQSVNNKRSFPENNEADAFPEVENGNNYIEPLDEESIEKFQKQMHASSATENFGFVSVREVDNDPKESADGDEGIVGDNNNKPISYEKEKIEGEPLFDSPFNAPVPIEHVISKAFIGHDEKKANINGKREVKNQDPKLEQRLSLGVSGYEAEGILKPKDGAHDNASMVGLIRDRNSANHEQIGSMLSGLQNKLFNVEEPANKLNQVVDEAASVSNLNKGSFNQQIEPNLNNDMDLRKAVDIKTVAYFRNTSSQNISSTVRPSKLNYNITNVLADHKIFPLKPEDELVDLPRMKYFQQCYHGENNNYHYSHGMPTKPPKMFSKYYISRLKKFQKYEDDSGIQDFLKQPSFPLFGTKESEVSKILNVNLDHLHIDKGALYKIIGKALKIDEENPREYAPPKWLETKYDELLHASHRGQNSNDYDYIEKARQMVRNDRFNIRNRKESIYDRNNTSS